MSGGLLTYHHVADTSHYAWQVLGTAFQPWFLPRIGGPLTDRQDDYRFLIVHGSWGSSPRYFSASPLVYIAHDGLPALVDVDVLNGHFLLSLASVAIESFYLSSKGP